ncbi:MAG: STAS domain-containing protein [Chloroflexota bacterium]|jgi:anti-sigma B factor antagonist|nr:STAS domain-containing protein [Chloroflexota bacterium]
MEVSQRTEGEVEVIAISGEIDGSTAPAAQSQILSVAKSDAKILIDMSQVHYMSSAGLRMLLVVYRTVSGQGGKVVLTGLSQDLEDTMSLTGFLDFFDHFESVDAGLAAFN